MKTLQDMLSILITITVFSVYVTVVDGALALGIFIISLGISSGIYLIPIIIGGILIYMSFVNSEVLCQDLESVVNGNLKYIIHGYDSFDNDKYKDNDTRKEVTGSEEDNDETETLSEKMNILKEYIHYQDSNKYINREVKKQLSNMIEIQYQINNLERFMNEKIVLQIEDVWKKFKLNIVNNLIQILTCSTYVSLSEQIENEVVEKLIQENNDLLEAQEEFLNYIIELKIKKLLTEKEQEHKYLILELDAMKTAISSVINTY